MNIWPSALLLTCLTALSACSKEEPVLNSGTNSAIHNPNLQTQVARKSKTYTYASFEGTVEAVNKATVSAQTAGRVALLPFDIGDYVEQGATIAKLTSVEQNASVEAASSQVAETKALALEAQNNFDRSKNIYAKKLISKADFDRATTALKAAQSRMENAQAALNTAQQNLSYTHLKAPYSGIVYTRHVQVGEVVAPGTPILSGVSLDKVRVLTDVPQQYVDILKKQAFVRVTLTNETVFTSTSIHISPSADPTTHTFRVLIDLADTNGIVFPGSRVKVSFSAAESEQLHIPQSALVKRGEILAVYVINDSGLIHLNYIRVGDPIPSIQNETNVIAVLSGLSEGERIALDPIEAAIAYKLQRSALSRADSLETTR